MRCPLTSARNIASRISFTATSASLATSCGKRAASCAISSDLVITNYTLVLLLVQFCFEQSTKVGCARGTRTVGSQASHSFVLFVLLFLTDGQVDLTGLAIHVNDQRFQFSTFFQNGRQVFNAVTRELGSTQVAFYFF